MTSQTVSTHSDGKLVRAIRAGRTEVFEELVLRWQKPAFAVAVGVGIPPDLVADTLQEAFVRALREIDTLREPGAFGPWLLAIVRNVARRQLSDARRMVLTPKVDRGSESYADPLERRELNQYIWSKLEELPTIVRESLVLYYWEGESTRDVARALDISVPAVKNRLHKGRELLRERLWREIGVFLRDMLPSARQWKRGARHISLIALASLPAGWWTPVSASTASTMSSGLFQARMIGSVVTMSGKNIQFLAVGVVCLFAACFFAGYSTGDVPEREGADAKPAVAQRPGPRPREEPAASYRLPERERASAPEAPEVAVAERKPRRDPSTGSVRVSVVWTRTNDPAAGVRVDIQPANTTFPRYVLYGGTTDDRGVVLVESLPPGTATVRADRAWPRGHIRSSRVEIVAGDTTEFLLRLEDGVTVQGRVVSASRRPVPEAEIWLTLDEFDSRSGRLIARTDENGAFSLPGVEAGRYVYARAPGHAPSRLYAARGERGDTMEVELRLPGAGGSVSGHVFGPDGTPVTEAVVMIGDRKGPGGSYIAPPAPVTARTDREGFFSAEGLTPGRAEVFVRAPELAPAEVAVEVLAQRDIPVRIDLAPGASLRGRVLDESGAPVERARVRLGDLEDHHYQTNPANTLATTDAEGEFLVAGLPGVAARVEITAAGLQSFRDEVALETGGSTEIEVQLAPTTTLRGRVLYEDGRPVTDGVVIVAGGWKRLDGEGRFEVEGVEDREYRLTVQEHGQRFECVRTRVRPSPDEIEIVVREAERATAYIAGKVVDPDGRSIWKAEVICLKRNPAHQGTARTGFFGGFRVGPLPPGEYRVGAAVKSGARTWLEKVVRVGPGETIALGTISLVRSGLLRTVFSEGETQEGLWFLVLDDKDLPVVGEYITSEPSRRDPIAPGQHRVTLRREGRAVFERAVEIRAGEETVLRILPEDIDE